MIPVRLLALLTLVITVSGCVWESDPSVTVRPTPNERAIYWMLVEKYTFPAITMSIDAMSADEAARMLSAMQGIKPPEGCEALHEQALDAWRQICMGKLLLVGADSMVRAEAYFMVDWGVSRLIDYREHIDQAQ